MERHVSSRALLDAVARELAAVLEANRLPRTARGEGRDLLMRAWLALEAPGDAEDPAVRDLSRRIDRLVALASVPATGRGCPAAGPDRLRIADRLLEFRRDPLLQHLSALQNSIDALAHRTRRMVEKAEATARGAGTRFATPPPSPGPAKRESLELVWGDDET